MSQVVVVGVVVVVVGGSRHPLLAMRTPWRAMPRLRTVDGAAIGRLSLPHRVRWDAPAGRQGLASCDALACGVLVLKVLWLKYGRQSTERAAIDCVSIGKAASRFEVPRGASDVVERIVLDVLPALDEACLRIANSAALQRHWLICNAPLVALKPPGIVRLLSAILAVFAKLTNLRNGRVRSGRARTGWGAPR